MKKKGTRHYLLRYRDREILERYKSIAYDGRGLGWRNVYEELAESPSSRFWVGEQRALEAVRAILAGHTPCASRLRNEMYTEIKERALRILGTRAAPTLADAVAEAVNSPAPKFYITPVSAMTVVSRAKKRRAEETMRRMMFLRG